MRIEAYHCDVCGKELESKSGMDQSIQVIFTTEQNQGITTKPYLEIVKMDICDRCKGKVIMGNAIYGNGAMGHNKYYFASQDA